MCDHDDDEKCILFFHLISFFVLYLWFSLDFLDFFKTYDNYIFLLLIKFCSCTISSFIRFLYRFSLFFTDYRSKMDKIKKTEKRNNFDT